MTEDVKTLQEMFKQKFGKLPRITFEKIQNYGENFIIWKQDSLLDKTPYYKMGKTLESCIHYIDRLIMIPSNILVFETPEQKETYELKLELLKLKDEK